MKELLRALSNATAAMPPASVPACNCAHDPAECLKELFVDYAQGRALAAGRTPATRPVFLRLHGVAYGRLEINPQLPHELRVGVFAQQTAYPVWVRFSSDVQPGTPDFKSTCGIALKLFGVKGPKLLS